MKELLTINPSTSKRWHVSIDDVKKIVKNALIFTAPILITWVMMAQNGVTEVNEFYIVGQVWILGVTLDFLRKLSKDNK